MARIENDFLLPVPSVEAARAVAQAKNLSAQYVYDLMVDARAEQIEARTKDPFRYGYVPKIWTVVWSLLDWPYWPVALEKDAVAQSGAKDIWDFMDRMRRALGFRHRVKMVWVSGANRSGKTEMTSYMINAHMAGKEKTQIVPMSTTAPQSVKSEFQLKVYRYIPNEWKHVGRSAEAYVAFKEKTGFSDNSFIFPNGSNCNFMFYAQDPATVGEGWSADGVFPDETIPADWFARIGPRLTAKDGYCVLTNTPQTGYTDVVHQFMNGVRITRWATGYMLPKDGGPASVARQIGLTDEELAGLKADRESRPQKPARVPESRPEDTWRWISEAGADWRSREASLAEAPTVQEGNRLYEAVPRVGRCEDEDKAIVWFHGSDNPFAQPRNLLNLSAANDRDWTRCRVYGVVSPAQKSVFTMFRRPVHVVPDEAVPTDGTRYMVLDPAFARNGFMLWAVKKGDTMWVYREFPGSYSVPDKGVPGPWAKTSGKKGGANDGEKDEGAASFGWGYCRYKNLIARLEGWTAAKGTPVDAPWDPEEDVRTWRDSPYGDDTAEPIHRRLMDPRGGSATFVASEGTSTPIIEYQKLGMRFEPAFSGSITSGVDAIIDALDFADGKQPKLFIAASCRNLIWCMENWKALDGEKGATKDPIDCLRYLFTSGCIDTGVSPPACRVDNRRSWHSSEARRYHGRAKTRVF